MAEGECSTDPLLSRNVTISYGAIYAAFVVAVSIYSFIFLMKFNQKFIQSSFKKKFKIWIVDSWKRRKCYVPIVVHIFDQVTDVAVTIQFYSLANDKKEDDEWTDCNGLNIWYLFILTVLSMVIYRLFSSFLIFQNAKSISRAIFQLLDLELLRALYINYLCDKVEPCDPQRWITSFEATDTVDLFSQNRNFLIKSTRFNIVYVVFIEHCIEAHF